MRRWRWRPIADSRWAASDNGVLARTLGRDAGVDVTYQAYLWQQDGREMRMLFRDHYLSDLIGFEYSAHERRRTRRSIF